MSSIEVVPARNLGEALDALAARPTLLPLAGGTDVLVALDARAIAPEAVLDLGRLRELRYVRVEGGALVIGALATYTDLLRSDAVAAFAPELRACAAEVGAAAIQNRGTLGGSVANASPAGDPLPVLLARDAVLTLVSAAGTRDVPATRFFTSYRKTALAPGELIAAIRLPLLARGERTFWRKVGTRRAQSIAKMVVAARARIDGTALAAISIGVGCAGPIPLRAPKTEAVLAGRALDAATFAAARASLSAEVAPIDDLRSTETYRRRVAGNVLATWLESLAPTA